MSDIKPSHYFKPEEINVLIPKMEEHFENFWAHRQNAQDILQELRRFSQQSDLTLAADLAHYQVRQGQARFLMDQAQKEVHAIFDLGCLVKDLEIGLVDFYALMDKEEVFLCWKYGEKKVRHWHDIHEGFDSRKNLDRKS